MYVLGVLGRKEKTMSLRVRNYHCEIQWRHCFGGPLSWCCRGLETVEGVWDLSRTMLMGNNPFVEDQG